METYKIVMLAILAALEITADGGVWKLEAARNVAAYFEENLHDLIESGAVVVIR